jgi:tRNA (guanine-N7-)-methyltransferase
MITGSPAFAGDDNMIDEHKRKPDARAFFGRRRGHKLKPRQAALFETLLPQLAIDLSANPPTKLQALFNDIDQVRLEIGFGGGEHMIAEAINHPRTGFIGSEPFVNGMAKALALIEQHGLKNIRLQHGDATALIAWLPDGALTRVDLIYPDPWPKRRHWKRRFVQPRSIGEIARILQGGGEFRFATDIADYAAWTLRHMQRTSEFNWTAERADDWRNPWPGFSSTRYELKAKRSGRVPCYLIFRRN